MNTPQKIARALTKRGRIAYWRATASIRRAPVTGDVPVVVSLTSYGHRIGTVFVAIESIGAGDAKPARLILWLSHEDYAEALPATLRGLRRRGLEIIPCDDYRSHKKYYPYAISAETVPLPLLTADDDAVYPRDWLSRLWSVARKHPRNVIGYRSKTMQFDEAGHVLPYNTWPIRTTADASYRAFMTGVSGVFYPIEVVEESRNYGTEFMQSCPNGDDLWLHRSALRAGMPPRQVSAEAIDLPGVPSAQQSALMTSNIDSGGNDAQLHKTYTAADLERIHDSD
ncbi:hypothetical protein HQQ80_07165 [Microbacteriaceae bacterium VKM Ac-2855]|nr:hypothetical protein [Microbacteriaceae bacterium VKM Ac-2855]